jgi:hypothetical protein
VNFVERSAAGERELEAEFIEAAVRAVGFVEFTMMRMG